MYIPLLSALPAAQTADALYADRANLASAVQAAALLNEASRVAPADFDAAWKLSRVCYFLGGHAPARDRRAALEQGLAAGERARRLAPHRPEGHFWMAANMGALAEGFGMRAGLKYRTPIRTALEAVLRIDPAFMRGSADRALGRFFHKVPAFLGGSRTRAERHLRASLGYDPQNTASLFFLGELLLDDGRAAEARTVLQQVLDAPLSADWAPEDRDFKEKARTRLATLGR